MSRFRTLVALALVCVVASGCVGALQGGTVSFRPPQTPAANPSGCLAFWITDATTHAPLKAHIVLGRDQAIPLDTNADGYAYTIQATAKYQVTVTAEGYVPFVGSYDVTAWDCDTPIGLTSAHVDPASIARDKLLAFRGSLFTVVADCQLPMFLPSGDAVPVVPFAPVWATPTQRTCTYDQWRKRGYTHGVIGPFIDPGYHNETPSYDFRANPDAALDQLQEAWDQGFYPIVVIVPDHWGKAEGWGEHIWTVEDLKALEPIYRSPRFQRLARIVMLCWECQNGDVYGWANTTYLAYGRWLADVFPNAIRVLHTIADIEVPVGQGDELNTANCHGLGPDKCLSSGEAWTRVARYFDVWFEQSSALFRPDHLADNGHTDSDNWLRLLWDASNPGSLTRRFRDGSNGYPTSMFAIPAEYLSYLIWNGNASEDAARAAGDRAIDAGARGAMDGCGRCGR